MNDYQRGQNDLISYIRANILSIIKTSKGSDVVLDVINFLKSLRPLKKPTDNNE
jgi:hypothetical protein